VSPPIPAAGFDRHHAVAFTIRDADRKGGATSPEIVIDVLGYNIPGEWTAQVLR